jgi:hypothetical protein
MQVTMVYNDLEKHFEGRDAKDVLYHTMNLHRFTAQPKEFDIKEDIVRLDCGQDALWNLGRERKGKERLNVKIC